MLGLVAVSLCAFSAQTPPQTPPLTVCVGARCWRNGAGMFIDAAQRMGLAARGVGCSGVCPQGAVSACEGPECPGSPLLLKALDAEEAETVLAAAARTTTPRACMGDSDEVLDVKYAIAVAVAARDGIRLGQLVDELEPLCEVERPATSPLIDGTWEEVFSSSPPRWTRARRLCHSIESAAPSSPSPVTELSGPPTRSAGGRGARSLRSSPAGTLWDDVRSGRGAYVQRARALMGTREVRATYSWLGGEQWELTFVSASRLLLGIPLWSSPVADADADLDHCLRPTYVDGSFLVLRSPAVCVGDVELRTERVYLLRRQRNPLWQDDTFVGLSDRVGLEP